ETEWSPDRLYEYNNCNYDLAYCCDANTLPHRSMHYKRVNLEDSGYYTDAAAQHIRAIANISYPFVDMDEMKQLLIERGFPAEKANALTRSDMISAVQMAIWSYANISTYLEPDYLENITHYGGTAEIVRLPDARYWLRTPTLHDYRNEMWIWYNSNTFPMENSYWGESHWTFYDDIQDRVNSLVAFLHDLDPVAPADNEIVISDVNITRSAPIDQDGTYMVDLTISLNHGAASGNVTITITSSNGSSVTNSRTITVDAGDTYSTTIIVKDGDRVDVVADGYQVLPRGTYFYLPEVGYENSQALVGVAEGETKVHAEDHFEFHAEGDLGLRIFQKVKGSSIPISGITLHAYTMDAAQSGLPRGDASEEDIAACVKPENLAATVETDSTGYAFMELSRGSYIIVEELNADKVKEVVPPIDVNIPTPVESRDNNGDVIIEYLDVVEEHIDNPPRDIPGTVSVFLEAEKQFNDWGRADSFSFVLEAVTPGAPMPSETVATAVKEDPVAVFPQIVYDAICFENGDPQSDVREFAYTITEIDDQIPGVTYDTTPHQVVVTVTRSSHIEVINSYGDEIVVTEYTAKVTYDGTDSLIITNTFDPVTAHFEATKEFNDWGKADSFTFVLEAVTEDAPMPKVTEVTVSETSPTAVFETLSFDKVGTYEYTITEFDDGVDGVTYDTTPHAAVVTVTKGEGNVLSAKVTYDGSDSLIITNTYSPG
ncbi:MAG: Cys-Gln thioester bond-forming surface protein, partial [Clostridia bacterium]|nr:Cys-Gln thioester bond-forming surface protein [Clostridia bacterium]